MLDELTPIATRINSVLKLLSDGEELPAKDKEFAERIIKASKPTVFANLKSAAAALNVPVALLRRLKSENAPGFRPYGSRIYLEELQPALDAALRITDVSVEMDKSKLETRDLAAKAQMRELKLQQASEKLVDKQLIADHIIRFAAEVKQVLRQKENELPALIVGLDQDKIRPMLISHLTDDILQKFSAHFDTWTI